MSFDDETLMAYADGELDAGLRAEITAAIEKDPELARRVEKHRALRTEVAGAFATVLDRPVPERLRTAARASAVERTAGERGNVLRFPGRATRAPSPPWRAREWGAMAASLVLGVLIAWRLLTPDGTQVLTASQDGLVARGMLAAALDGQLASTQPRDAAVLIGLTFRTHDGSYCRSFTLRQTGTAGLACRADGEWRVPMTTSVAGVQGEVHPAGIPRPLFEAMQSRIAGESLDAHAEQAAQGAGWQPSVEPK